MKRRFAIDSLAMRDGRLFGWGWYVSASGHPTRVDLVLEPARGEATRIACQRSGHRQDLAAAFPDRPHAASGGLMIHGRWPAPRAGDRTYLEVLGADGKLDRIELPGFPERYLARDGSRLAGLVSRRQVAVELLRRGRFGELARRSWHGLRRRLEEARRRRPIARGYVGVDVVLFDHAMGGGTNHFRDERVRALRAEGKTLLLVTPQLASLRYEIERIDAEGSSCARHDTLAECLAALPDAGTVVVNNLVSYDDPLRVLEWIGAWRARLGGAGRLDFYLHDYFAICPSWTLTDYTHRFCGLPGPAQCALCLSRNDAAFLPLLPRLDMPEWRSRWRAFLHSADRITAFSEASLRLLREAYPDLPAERLQVRAHDTSHADHVRVRPSTAPELVVGVVGAINVYKGAEMLAEMARRVEADSLPMRFVVIGSVDGVAPSPALSITGRYARADLPRLLEQHRVSLCLLPSICHETFSFVTSELLGMGMPLASFDLGAPAERIRAHQLGCIIPEVDAGAALDALFRFHERLLGGHSGPDASLPARVSR